jgi:hypothetical protein
MFTRKTFADLRRAGMGVGASKTKLFEAMLEILLQLPTGSTNLKDTIVMHLGLMGQMFSTRDIDQAWIQVKKKAAKLHPEKFILDNRNTLLWNDGSVKVIDKDISLANLKKINELANNDGCSANAMVSKLLKAYKQK